MTPEQRQRVLDQVYRIEKPGGAHLSEEALEAEEPQTKEGDERLRPSFAEPE